MEIKSSKPMKDSGDECHSINEYEEIAKRLDDSHTMLDLLSACLSTPENMTNLKPKLVQASSEKGGITLRVKIIRLQSDEDIGNSIHLSIYRVEMTDAGIRAFVMIKRRKETQLDLIVGQHYIVDKVKITINKKGEVVLSSTELTVIRSLELSQHDEMMDEEEEEMKQPSRPIVKSTLEFTSDKQILEACYNLLRPDREDQLLNFRDLLSWKMPEHFCSNLNKNTKRAQSIDISGVPVAITNQINLYKYDIITQRIKEQRVTFVGIVTHVKSYLYILYEAASGYCLFEKEEFDETGGQLKTIQKAIPNIERFSKMIKLAAFQPFKTAEEALENISMIAKNSVSETLKNFLITNLPATKSSKKQKFLLGIAEPMLGSKIFAETGITASFNESIEELIRGIRTHLPKLLKKLSDEDMTRASLGLAHQYSRDQCATDANRQDKPIIQTIALIETMDKNINTFVMRLKEWFSWHFPELGKIITDNTIFCKVVHMIEKRENVTEDIKDQLVELVLDEDKAQEVIEAAKISMGQELSDADVIQVKKFSERVVDQIEFRERLQEYLRQRMNAVAPNLTSLIGEMVGSKLISHSGSLINLAKYPASTIQILGAEKALFRALKTRGKTPKYGLIFNSSFIGRAGQKNKGRISRYLANKCAIAARIDSFSEKSQTTAFGEKLKEQMEERLAFLATGAKPKKNKDAMKEVLDELKAEGLYYDGSKAPAKEEKKAKKDKKRKHREEESDEEVEEIKPKKKKSKTQ